MSATIRRGLWVLLLLLVGVPVAVSPHAAAIQGPADAIDARFAAIEGLAAALVEEQEAVGLSLAVVVEGAVAHQAHFGWEDREAEVPASAATRYRWASISKPLTAVAALQLWEQEKLDLERDVRSLVPTFPDKAAIITVRHLLCHQGGIVHYGNGAVLRSPAPEGLEHPDRDVVVALRRFQDSPLVCEPGSAYSYTTHGYMLLGAAVQVAGEEPYALQVRRRIGDPLALASLRPDYQWESIEHRAVGYRKTRLGTLRSTDTDVSWKLAGGGWISTVEDLAGFGAGLLGDRLFEPATRELMWTRQKTRDGEATSYGLGFVVGKRNGRAYAWHSGSQEKAETFLLLDRDSRAGVALMCNTNGVALGDLAFEIAARLVP